MVIEICSVKIDHSSISCTMRGPVPKSKTVVLVITFKLIKGAHDLPLP